MVSEWLAISDKVLGNINELKTVYVIKILFVYLCYQFGHGIACKFAVFLYQSWYCLQHRSGFVQLDFASHGASSETEPCWKEIYVFIEIITFATSCTANADCSYYWWCYCNACNEVWWCLFRIWYSHGIGYEEFRVQCCNTTWSLDVDLWFRGIWHLHVQGWPISQQ